MKDTRVIERSSVLHAEPTVVWSAVRTMKGVNEELSPWVRMTFPPEATVIEDAPLGEPAFHSVLLFLGVVPFDRHRLVLVEVEPGRRFLERSSSWLQGLWEHERVIEPHPEGCRLTDRVTFRTRLPLMGVLIQPIVLTLFRSRHQVLKKRYNTK